jgi:iron complex transport system substrate-binding protein
VSFSCGNQAQKSNENQPEYSAKIKYSQGFAIDYFADYKVITIYNPWAKNAIQQKIYLVKNKNISVSNDGIKIVTPLKKMAVGSCTYFEFLAQISELECVKGVCSLNLVYNQKIADKAAKKEIIDLGDAFTPNLEKIMLLQPDIFMLPSYNAQDETANRLLKSGVAVVYNNEWTENSLLARAEWLKMIAAFFDKENLADSIFSEIEKNYLTAKQLVENVKVKPTIMAGGNFKGTWYMASGKSYMGNLFVDAGGKYFYENDTTKGSLSLSFESVLHNFHNTDIWLNAPVKTLAELQQMDTRHELFKPMQTKNVFAFMAKTHPNGANDFWESAVAHPDIVLKDVIWALHPALLSNYLPVYILKLE